MTKKYTFVELKRGKFLKSRRFWSKNWSFWVSTLVKSTRMATNLAKMPNFSSIRGPISKRRRFWSKIWTNWISSLVKWAKKLNNTTMSNSWAKKGTDLKKWCQICPILKHLHSFQPTVLPAVMITPVYFHHNASFYDYNDIFPYNVQ